MWYFEPVWNFREKGAVDDERRASSGAEGGQPAQPAPPPAAPPPQPKPFTVETVHHPSPNDPTGAAGLTRTNHTSPDLIHHLEVETYRYPNGQANHHVALIQRGGRGKAGMGTTRLHIGTNGNGWIDRPTANGGGFTTQVGEVPPDLVSLVASHHQNQAWAPLLDKLAEVYPDHFNAQVTAHTAARNRVPRRRKPPQWTSNQTVTGEGTPHQTTTVVHRSPDGRTGLGVTASSIPDQPSHVVNLYHQPDRGPAQESQLLMLPDGATFVRPHPAGVRMSVEPASPELRDAISGFHRSEDWQGLLSRMKAEYPEHFSSHVDNHYRARLVSPPVQPPPPAG